MFPTFEWWRMNGPPLWGWVLIVVVPVVIMWGVWVTLQLSRRDEGGSQ